MNELIKIEIKEDGRRLVSGRELHEFLQVGRDFTTCVKGRIVEYDFIENVDFTVVSIAPRNGGANNRGGKNKVDYAITIEMAKELCMVEKNEYGKQARRYFIECEKKLKEQKTDSYLIEDKVLRAKRWIEEEEERRRLESKIEDQKPMVQLAENRIDKKGCFSLTDVNKTLGLKRGLISRWAKDKGYLHKTQTEVNKTGETYFKVYSSDGKHNQIGITEVGLKYIKENIEEIEKY